MTRLQLKAQLIAQMNAVFVEIGRRPEHSSWLFRYRAKRSIYKDFVEGLKQINKKVPVYVELPKLRDEGDGTYSEIEDDEVKEVVIPDDKQIVDVEGVKLIEK